MNQADTDYLLKLLYDEVITKNQIIDLINLYESGFEFFFEIDECDKWITFNYGDFLLVSNGNFNLELYEDCIEKLVSVGITELIIDFKHNYTLELLEYLVWQTKFFYYQHTEGENKDTEEIKFVFENNKFLPYKFDTSDISYSRELSIYIQGEE